MADIFISYKSTDRQRVAPIVALLESRGWSVWWDTRIGAGETWDEVIERELEIAQCVVVVWSIESIASRWVRAEASEGLERGILVPVHIDVAKPPLEFKLIQSINLSAWRGDTGSLAAEALTNAVSKLLGQSSAQTTQLSRPVAEMIGLPRVLKPHKPAEAKEDAAPSRARILQPRTTMFVALAGVVILVPSVLSLSGWLGQATKPQTITLDGRLPAKLAEPASVATGAGPDHAYAPPPINQPAPTHDKYAGRPVERPRSIASGATIQVQQGDTLYGIAKRYGVSISALIEVNNLGNGATIKPGQQLLLPAGAIAPSVVQNEPAVPSPAHILNPPAEQRTAALGDRLNDVTAVATEPTPAQEAAPTKFRWPARGRIIATFGKRTDGTHNDGINIAIPQGTDVHAAETGRVAYAGNDLKPYGNLVIIKHDNGWVSTYAHSDQILVKRDDVVRRGQVIAKAGKTGTVDQPQLHFELRQGAKAVDPTPHMEK